MADREQHGRAPARQGPSAPARREGNECGAGFHLLPSPGGVSTGSQTHGAGGHVWGSVAGTRSSPARHHWGPCRATATKGQLWGLRGIVKGFP